MCDLKFTTYFEYWSEKSLMQYSSSTYTTIRKQESTQKCENGIGSSQTTIYHQVECDIIFRFCYICYRCSITQRFKSVKNIDDNIFCISVQRRKNKNKYFYTSKSSTSMLFLKKWKWFIKASHLFVHFMKISIRFILEI